MAVVARPAQPGPAAQRRMEPSAPPRNNPCLFGQNCLAMKQQRLFVAALALLCTAALWVARANAAETPPLADVVITATRVAVPAFNVPASISDVPAAALREDAVGVNLSDDIGFVPGLLARNRNNYAQDQQISIRGVGANSTFGVRGVRIYQDGIPQTGPDGQ